MCSYLCASVCIYFVLCNFITFKSVYLLPQSRSWTVPSPPKSLLLLFYNHTYLPITLPHTFSENHKSVLQLCNSVISRVLDKWNNTVCNLLQLAFFLSWIFRRFSQVVASSILQMQMCPHVCDIPFWIFFVIHHSIIFQYPVGIIASCASLYTLLSSPLLYREPIFTLLPEVTTLWDTATCVYYFLLVPRKTEILICV